MSELTDFEKDKLTEVVSIGAGNAATALSKMINKSVKLSVPEVFLQAWEKIPQSVGDSQEVVSTVLLQVRGDIPAVILLIIPKDSAINLSAILTGKNEIDPSVLGEVGNILSGSALTALATFLKMKMMESVPEVVTDMLGSILISVLAEMGHTGDQLLVFKSSLFVEKENINGHLIFIFNSQASQKIING